MTKKQEAALKLQAEKEAADAIEAQVAPPIDDIAILKSQLTHANARNEALLKDVQGRMRQALNDMEVALADTDKFVQVR